MLVMILISMDNRTYKYKKNSVCVKNINKNNFEKEMEKKYVFDRFLLLAFCFSLTINIQKIYLLYIENDLSYIYTKKRNSFFKNEVLDL